MKTNLEIRLIKEEDPAIIDLAFARENRSKSIDQYTYYYELQKEGKRDVIIAEKNGDFAGYLTVKWEANYLPFREKGIPEIVDFNVLNKFQRQGIGNALMEEAEKRIRKVSKFAGIGFGVYKDYGAAQRLYVKRGYIPDGMGMVKDSAPIPPGTMVRVDDDLVICLTKEL
ncbi:MAG: GNAT family N-acetyltransferase [Bacteroidota bacterium]